MVVKFWPMRSMLLLPFYAGTKKVSRVQPM